MKKLFLLVLMVCAVSVAVFAQESGRDTYVSVNFGIPIAATYADYDVFGETLTSDTSSTSIGFGVSAAHYFNRLVGIYADIDFFFPMSVSIDNGYEEESYSRGDFDSAFGISLLVGPSFSFIRNDRMLLALSPGFHYMYLGLEQSFEIYDEDLGVSAGYTGTNSGHYFGLGANLEFGFKVTQLIYLRASLAFAFDFAGTETQSAEFSVLGYSESSDVDSDSAIALMFQPRIGVGFNF